jgi:hypothetical protein
MSEIQVLRIDRLDLTFAERPWAFAERNRAEIDAHFAARHRDNPALWNGDVLMLQDHAIDGLVFRGTFIGVDFASLLTWQDWGRPEAGTKDCFAQGALRAADGAFLLGVMSPRTANAGRIYFPSGIPDRSDIVGAKVDLEGSIWRELHEETGLTRADVAAESGWTMVLAGQHLTHFKLLQASEGAEELRAQVLEFISRQNQPELIDIRLVRSPADFDPMMGDYVKAFLLDVWQRR